MQDSGLILWDAFCLLHSWLVATYVVGLQIAWLVMIQWWFPLLVLASLDVWLGVRLFTHMMREPTTLCRGLCTLVARYPAAFATAVGMCWHYTHILTTEPAALASANVLLVIGLGLGASCAHVLRVNHRRVLVRRVVDSAV